MILGELKTVHLHSNKFLKFILKLDERLEDNLLGSNFGALQTYPT